jgi:tetratricopeptide (TPR) repeat protein
MSQAQVTQLMQNIALALGVQCGYCHMPAASPEAGRGRGGRGVAAVAFDFVSDEKPQKKIARQMMVMVRDVNQTIEAAVANTASVSTRVACVTCHRGVAVPRPLDEILDQITKEKGALAAVAQFKELRRQYFGAQAYDFSEASVIAYAQRAAEAGRADEAIMWLELNLDYFPLSAPTYAGLAQALQRKNDRNAAIKSLERAVELDPQNVQFRRQLDQLKGSAK